MESELLFSHNLLALKVCNVNIVGTTFGINTTLPSAFLLLPFAPASMILSGETPPYLYFLCQRKISAE
jgi:hypothetical protein